MELGLRDRGVLVTGGSMGIGKATALALASEGAHVAICARGNTFLESVAAKRDWHQLGLPLASSPRSAELNSDCDGLGWLNQEVFPRLRSLPG